MQQCILHWSMRYKVICLTKWIARNSVSVGIRLLMNMAVICESCGRVMWISIHSYFYASTLVPPQKNEKVHHTTLCHFFALRKPFPAAATHHTGHHPVIWHRDVPPQECCTSGIPSAMPKDNFPASTFDSHLQSASFGDNIAN